MNIPVSPEMRRRIVDCLAQLDTEASTSAAARGELAEKISTREVEQTRVQGEIAALKDQMAKQGGLDSAGGYAVGAVGEIQARELRLSALAVILADLRGKLAAVARVNLAPACHLVRREIIPYWGSAFPGVFADSLGQIIRARQHAINLAGLTDVPLQLRNLAAQVDAGCGEDFLRAVFARALEGNPILHPQ